jgi:hypothetical protein
MHIYVGIARSLETSNPWILEKVRHVQSWIDEHIANWCKDFYL